MNKLVIKSIIAVIIAYIGLCIYSVEIANICILLLVVISIPVIIIKNTLRKKPVITYKGIPDNRFLVQKNVLENTYIIVEYERNSYIFVKDNPKVSSASRDIRSFRIPHGENYNVNESWHHICQSFNERSTLESLISYFGGGIKIKVSAKRKFTSNNETHRDDNPHRIENGQKEIFVDIKNIVADKSVTSKTKDEPSQKITQSQSEKPKFENDSKKIKNNNQEELFDFSDLFGKGTKKININTAQASEIAILPGINIVIAKKVVSHRQTKGPFKTEEEFFEYTKLKEHFIERIKGMISFDLPEDTNSSDDSYRIVD